MVGEVLVCGGQGAVWWERYRCVVGGVQCGGRCRCDGRGAGVWWEVQVCDGRGEGVWWEVKVYNGRMQVLAAVCVPDP